MEKCFDERSDDLINNGQWFDGLLTDGSIDFQMHCFWWMTLDIKTNEKKVISNSSMNYELSIKWELKSKNIYNVLNLKYMREMV